MSTQFIDLFKVHDLTNLGFDLISWVNDDDTYPDPYYNKLILHYCYLNDSWMVFGVDEDTFREFDTEQEALDYMIPLLDHKYPELYDRNGHFFIGLKELRQNV